MAYSLFTKLSISGVLLCAVGGSHALAKLTPPPPPPPPSISSINQYGITDERLWTKDKAAEVKGTINLTAELCNTDISSYYSSKQEEGYLGRMSTFLGLVRLTGSQNKFEVWGNEVISKVVVDNPNGQVATIDFGCGEFDPGEETSLVINDLLIEPGAVLVFENTWDDLSILIKDSQGIRDVIGNIAFRTGRGELVKATWVSAGGYLQAYATSTAWTAPPVPEPAVYGAALSLVGLGLVGYRRRQRRNRCVFTAPPANPKRLARGLVQTLPHCG